MKNGIKAGIAVLAVVSMLSACKGGASGEKMDSTMVNKESMDSSATLNNKAGTMSADTNSTKHDAAQTDTSKK